MSENKTFYAYFKENMEGLGLPAPESLFSTVAAAVGTISAMVAVLEKYGENVTVAELVGTGSAASEYLLVVGACSAAFYVGACIGSLAVATGKKLSGGQNLFDCIEYLLSDIPVWLKEKTLTNPILNPALRGPLVTAHQGLWHYYSRW